MEGERLRRGLQAHAEIDVTEEEIQRPLVLSISTGGAKGDARIPVAGHDRWTQRGARSFPRRKRIDVPFNEPGHLSSSTKWKTQTGDDR